MKTKELRIGDLIEYNGNIYPVAAIDHNSVTIFRDNATICPSDRVINFIPLTEERLLKLGNAEKKRFPDEVDVYDRFRFIWKDAYKYWYVVTIKSKEYLTKIEFVHEYQNFIFALTGEELTM